MFIAVAEQGFDFIALLAKIWLGFQVVFGIGLMIFIHELGHFIAAKKIGVRVETFSLGFGLRIFGFRRGDTDYRLSAIPLGGYVKMAGENPDDPQTGAPDELQSRTAGERMVIFSAGVFMNLLFAFITIPIIFAVGIPFVKPEIGLVEPGGPAWVAGLQPGDTFLEVNGNTIYEFNDIPLNIALGKKDDNRIVVDRDGKELVFSVDSQMNDQEGRYQIRITSPTRFVVTVEKGSPAEEAGLLKGDRIVTVNGLDPRDWLDQGGASSMEPLVLEVARGEDQPTQKILIKPEEEVLEDRRLVGIKQRQNLVQGTRGLLAQYPNGLQKNDFILRVNAREIFDPKGLERALAESPELPLLFEVLREGAALSITYEAKWRQSLLTDLALAANSQTNSVVLSPGGALEELGDADIRDGMRILSVNGTVTNTFLEISEVVQETEEGPLELTFDLPDGVGTKVVQVEGKAYKKPWIGFDFLPDIQTRKLNLTQAIKAGFNCSLYMIKTCYLTLSRILTGEVGGKNLGGIITISRASYTFAELGFARLFFFLAILSINLGFLNVLPIPILDGGHLLFLLIEKIKGSPVNDKIMGYSQIVGLVFILALLIYVTYNDILRLIY